LAGLRLQPEQLFSLFFFGPSLFCLGGSQQVMNVAALKAFLVQTVAVLLQYDIAFAFGASV